MKTKIIIVGAGGIGRACGLMLLEHLGKDIELIIADISVTQCEEAVAWIDSGLNQTNTIRTIPLADQNLSEWNPEGHVILDCTPGKFAPDFARVALRNHMHYANLTEHIPATQEIYNLAQNAPTGFALQTGLAPGFINLLAMKSVEEYTRELPGHAIDRIRMRVGSLSQFASSPAHYAFVWSPMGVSTEYLNDSEVIEDFKKVSKPSLTDRERLVINGVAYEADLTSGGAADLPTYFEGKIKEVNYKTLRYPGHFDYILGLKKQLGENLTKQTLLQKMLEDIPVQDQDRVLIHCSVSGAGPDQKRFEKIHFREIPPISKGTIKITAIQRTTAASLAQTAVLLLSNRFSGVLTQSHYPLD
ncbi:MAG: saccharopine dehydrogenase family protein, partial [Sphaerochaetaceae bacterium]